MLIALSASTVIFAFLAFFNYWGKMTLAKQYSGLRASLRLSVFSLAQRRQDGYITVSELSDLLEGYLQIPQDTKAFTEIEAFIHDSIKEL